MSENVITLEDTVQDSVTKMSKGNSGAITVLCEILKKEPAIGIMLICKLDDANIRGSDIWVEYKDICGEDIEKFIAKIKNNEYYK